MASAALSLSNITRDLATPSVAIGECAASANRGFTGQGPMASAIDTSRSGRARRHARAGASPQPDPLGHLLSWHRRLPPEGDSDVACDPTEGRITRSSAKKTEIRRTRGAFHR